MKTTEMVVTFFFAILVAAVVLLLVRMNADDRITHIRIGGAMIVFSVLDKICYIPTRMNSRKRWDRSQQEKLHPEQYQDAQHQLDEKFTTDPWQDGPSQVDASNHGCSHGHR